MIVQRLVDKAVMTLAGKDDVAKAWATYVKPTDRVAVKFNGLFRRATTQPEVIRAVTNGLIKAGVDPAKIVVYDRNDKDMRTARLTINREGKGVRIYGTERSYGKPVKAGYAFKEQTQTDSRDLPHQPGDEASGGQIPGRGCQVIPVFLLQGSVLGGGGN